MNKVNLKLILQFLLFVFPCYFVIAFIVYCLFQGAVFWNEPSFIPLTLIVIGNIVTGVFLVKKQYWFSLIMIILGVYLVYTSKNYSHVYEVIELYGYYLIAHFSLCSMTLYALSARKKKKQ